MKLTALEIKQQTFDKAIRGYDPAEVQAFLTLVSNEWEHMVTQQSELEKQLHALTDRLKQYERVESALHETLQTAKESASQKLSGAKQESQNILQKAELQAEEIIREAYDQRREVRQDIIRLMDRRKELLAAIRSYLDNARESLNQFTDETDAPLPSLSHERRETGRRSDPSLSELTSDTSETPEKEATATDSKPSDKKTRDASDPLDSILDEID